MGNTTDRKIEQRRQVLEFCLTPRTIQEVADKFAIHYQTAWRIMDELRLQEQVKELPWTRDSKSQFQTSLEILDEFGEPKFTAGQIMFTVRQLIETFLTDDSLAVQKAATVIQTIPKSLITLYAQGKIREDAGTGEPGSHPAGFIPGPNKEAILSHFKTAISFLEDIQDLYRQLLSSPIWDKEDAHNYYEVGEDIDVLGVLDEYTEFLVQRGHIK